MGNGVAIERGRGQNSPPSLLLAHFAYRHCTSVVYFRAQALLLGIHSADSRRVIWRVGQERQPAYCNGLTEYVQVEVVNDAVL